MLAAPRQQPRASQSLGGVKCSACGLMIPIEELETHDADCTPQTIPEVPVLASRPGLPKPLMSPNSAASLLPQRLQGRVNNASPPPARQGDRTSVSSQRSSRSEAPPRRGAPEAAPQRNSTSNAPLNPRFANREPRGPSPLSRIPTADERARTQSAAPQPPDLGRDRLQDRLRTPSDVGSPRSRAESTASRPSFDSTPKPSLESSARPAYQRGPSSTPNVQPQPVSGGWTPQVAAPQSPREPDTKVGGDAGMAGVGRRGFAAAARAAMFTLAMPEQRAPPAPRSESPGMDGRRKNAPRHLDINTNESTTSGSGSSRAATTPPLSPGSESSSHSASVAHSSVPKTPENVARVPFFEKYRNKLPNVETNALDSAPSILKGDHEPAIRNPSSAGSGSDYTADLDFTTSTNDRPQSPLSDSDSDYGGGLAYADSDDDEPALGSTSILRSTPSSSSHIRFPSKDVKRSSDTSTLAEKEPAMRLGRDRSTSSASSKSATTTYSRSTAQSTGALGRAMETLFEDGAAPSSRSASTADHGKSRDEPSTPNQRHSNASSDRTKAQRSSTLTLSESPRTPKLPTRSQTSPSQKERERDTTARPSEKRAPKKKTCAKCNKDIHDGKWVQIESGGVLCERCWKNMYLPKCRRCNLVIEKQAVSSSDGQLKGKYHRACFNCATCQKPFPDKSFYVFDGKPLCAFHYHEANDSLCAAAKCGQPIEGPCAVSHAGDRYHPHHLTCEYAGNPRCSTQLSEYYEMDGRMLCERHANAKDANADEDDEDYVPSARAMKRITKFIDLGADGVGLR